MQDGKEFIINIVRRFRESSEILVRVGQGRRPPLKVYESLSAQIALHYKPSCCCVKYSHVLRSILENLCHLTQSDAASRNATRISVTQGEICTSVQCRDAAEFSGPEIQHVLFLEKTSAQSKGTIQTFVSERCKSKHLSWYGGTSVQTAWVACICVKESLT